MAHQTHSLSLRNILEKENLNDTNFLDWDYNLRIVLKQERKEYVLNAAIPQQHLLHRSTRDGYEKHASDAIDVACLMLASMEPGLQKSDGPYE